jgi:hypothetical protein
MYILPGPVDVNGAVDVFCANAWDRLYPGSPKRQSFATSSADEDFTVPLHALPDQITAHAVVARPYWADLAGTLPASPRICSVGTDSALEIRAAASSRIAVANIKQPSTVEATSVVFPAGPLVVTAQWRGLRTAGSCRVNVGGGWSAWSAAASGPTPLTGNTFNVGRGSSIHLDGDFRALILARGHHEPGAFAEWIP